MEARRYKNRLTLWVMAMSLLGCEEASSPSLGAEVESLEQALSAGPRTALAIITTHALADTSQALGAYVAQRRQTRPVYVVTEDRVNVGNGVTSTGGWAEGVNLTRPPSRESSSERADAIREWLQDNYISRGIRDVLLIGDPSPTGGTLPMKLLFSGKGVEELGNGTSPGHLACWSHYKWTCLDPNDPASYSDCTRFMAQDDLNRAEPTDYYYSNLTYAWPLDADGDIVDVIEADFSHQDVNVGRLPVYNNNVAAMDKLLRKFIAYSTSTNTAWRHNALLAMDRQGTSSGDNVPFGEAARTGIMTPAGYGTYRIYEPYTPSGCNTPECVISGDLSPTSYVNMGSVWAGRAWTRCSGAGCISPKRDFGVVLWAAHGWPTGAADIINLDNAADNYTGSLDDGHPAFTASVSCSNISPGSSNNLGTTLLGRGSIAVLGATAVSWPGGADYAHPYVNTSASTDVVYGFLHELVTNHRTAGEALSAVRTHLWESALDTFATPTPPQSQCHDWDRKKGWKVQLLLFNLFGDPTVGLDTAPTNPNVRALAPHVPTIVNVAPTAPVTFYAETWPSKDNPWWVANVVIALTTVDGHPIPAGTVWVNGAAYAIGGSYYQVVNVPDTGPYTIEVVSKAATRLQVILENR